LLERVRELMGEQLSASLALRRIASGLEDHILANGVSLCVHRPRRLIGLGVYVDPNVAEVMAEPRLHECACFRIKPLPRRAQCLTDHLVCIPGLISSGWFTLRLFLLD
jgi:hypothetical protein